VKNVLITTTNVLTIVYDVVAYDVVARYVVAYDAVADNSANNGCLTS